MLPPTSPPPSKSCSSRRRGSVNPKNRMTKIVYKICTKDCGTIAGPWETSIFNMVSALVISGALNACQSTRMIVIEANEALISVNYYSLSSNGSSCSVSKVVPIVLVYSST